MYVILPHVHTRTAYSYSHIHTQSRAINLTRGYVARNPTEKTNDDGDRVTGCERTSETSQKQSERTWTVCPLRDEFRDTITLRPYYIPLFRRVWCKSIPPIILLFLHHSPAIYSICLCPSVYLVVSLLLWTLPRGGHHTSSRTYPRGESNIFTSLTPLSVFRINDELHERKRNNE